MDNIEKQKRVDNIFWEIIHKGYKHIDIPYGLFKNVVANAGVRFRNSLPTLDIGKVQQELANSLKNGG